MWWNQRQGQIPPLSVVASFGFLFHINFFGATEWTFCIPLEPILVHRTSHRFWTNFEDAGCEKYGYLLRFFLNQLLHLVHFSTGLTQRCLEKAVTSIGSFVSHALFRSKSSPVLWIHPFSLVCVLFCLVFLLICVGNVQIHIYVDFQNFIYISLF